MNEHRGDRSVRLLLVDEQALLRSSLARLLATEPDFEVVAECDGAATAHQVLSSTAVDVILLHLLQSKGDSEEFISLARRRGFQGQFLLVAERADVADSARVIQLGAAGIFLKSDAPARLVQAIRVVAQGTVWLDQKIARLMAQYSVDRLTPAPAAPVGHLLTEREQRVLLGVLSGMTNRRIGESLGVSEGSVKASLQQLFHKAGVRTRSQLVRAALEGSLGAIPLPPAALAETTEAARPRVPSGRLAPPPPIV